MRRLLLLTLLLAPSMMAQTPDVIAELNQRYAKHMLRLKTPLVGDSLAFDINGAVTKGRPGIVGFDDALNVDVIKLKKGAILIEATRAILFASPTDGATSYGATKKAQLTLAMPPSVTVEVTEATIAKVFLTAGSRSCSAEEASEFNANAVSNPGAVPPVLNGPVLMCIPTGGRGYWGGKGMTPPKMVQSGRPVFPPLQSLAPKGSWAGEIKLFVLVDERGMPREAVAVGGPGLGAMYDRVGIHEWRFRPAEKDGVPVPAILRYEVSMSVN